MPQILKLQLRKAALWHSQVRPFFFRSPKKINSNLSGFMLYWLHTDEVSGGGTVNRHRLLQLPYLLLESGAMAIAA